jgi:hypothetical protein
MAYKLEPRILFGNMECKPWNVFLKHYHYKRKKEIEHHMFQDQEHMYYVCQLLCLGTVFFLWPSLCALKVFVIFLWNILHWLLYIEQVSWHSIKASNYNPITCPCIFACVVLISPCIFFCLVLILACIVTVCRWRVYCYCFPWSHYKALVQQHYQWACYGCWLSYLNDIRFVKGPQWT